MKLEALPDHIRWRSAFTYNRFRFEDDPRDRFRLFVEARNLEGEAFVANTCTWANAGGRDQAVFNPGQERACFGGIEIRF